MQQFSVMVSSESEAEEALTIIWHTLKVRGEIELIPMEAKFRVDVISERDLTASQIEKLPGKPV